MITRDELIAVLVEKINNEIPENRILDVIDLYKCTVIIDTFADAIPAAMHISRIRGSQFSPEAKSTNESPS